MPIDLLEPLSDVDAQRILENAELRERCRQTGVDLMQLVSNLRLNLDARIAQAQRLAQAQLARRKAQAAQTKRRNIVEFIDRLLLNEELQECCQKSDVDLAKALNSVFRTFDPRLDDCRERLAKVHAYKADRVTKLSSK